MKVTEKEAIERLDKTHYSAVLNGFCSGYVLGNINIQDVCKCIEFCRNAVEERWVQCDNPNCKIKHCGHREKHLETSNCFNPRLSCRCVKVEK